MAYYNTNLLRDSELDNARVVALTQDAQVLTFFRNNDERSWSPDQIWKLVFYKTVPLTSVRRSISDLTAAGYLEKMKTMVRGYYGKPVHTWRAKEECRG